MTGLANIIPSHIKDEGRLKELRFTRAQTRSYGRWRRGLYNAIMSTPDTLQVDGRFLSSLLLDAPAMMDLGGVQGLWLGDSCCNEPSIAEWRTFFSAFPSLDTLVVSHRPSLNIITALTLPKETPDATFVAPNLSTLRIYGNQIPSVLCLSIFAEQRDRRNNRLRLLEIISASTSPPSSGWGTPTVNAHPSPNTHVDNYNQQDQQAFDNGSSDHNGGGQGGTGNRELEVHPRWPSVLVADLITMGDYVETVDRTKVEMGAAFDIVPQWPPRAFTWLAQMMF
ncbi:hypothetical protein PC9H_003930 [Pleurotus ostreatus]|uniref:Uncharacterized protein n=1 Tax=Pleurotus ostreatus TaxID=5322 RepID=A0A8H7A396_PLEOS|nr:uncharacterized protein PC9H_003930 [Pleurotus ostreatus]KAF7437096.1 hypothetical protein PC9H_003930 [Pleurotus ostreatus]KAJ8702947.1 hypothetical protein PTI98_001616 [Pleurotus ostreatus]